MMQEIVSNPIQVFQRQAVTHYWPRIFLNGAVALFLDEDQRTLIKVMLAFVLPVVIVYAKVKLSELGASLPLLAKAITAAALCHQGSCS
jgi:hypothetical protein